AADAGAQDHAENIAASRRGAVARLAERKAIGIVGEPHRATQRDLEIAPEWPADEPGGVGVLDKTGSGDCGPRDADPDGHGPALLAFDVVDQRRHGRDRRVVIAGRGRDASARVDLARAIDGGSLDLSAAEIDADAKPCGHPTAR